MDLKTYQAEVAIADGIMGVAGVNKTETVVNILANDEKDAQEIVVGFFAHSGLASKVVDGVHTIYRTAAKNLPGAIRTVQVVSINEFVAAVKAIEETVIAEVQTLVKEVIAAVPESQAENKVADLTEEQQKAFEPVAETTDHQDGQASTETTTTE